jgi:GNAT superfamily N-acetyltransferase
MTKIRPMVNDDVAVCEEIWFEAFTTMRTRFAGEPPEAHDPQTAERTRARLAHLLATDPDGCWVAEDDEGNAVALTQSFVREDLWVLSLLGVSPRSQEKGTGKTLLDAALTYGADVPAGMIQSSPDPRAMRRYSQAGFDLNPSVAARGRVDPRRLATAGDVREGSQADLEFVAGLDRRLRRGAHGPDLEMLLAQGSQLWILEGRGYALTRGAAPLCMGAADDEAAAQLLRACLRSAGPDEHVNINWITASQQWAMRVALAAGLALQPFGPVMTRGMTGPPTPYLPSGAFA